MTGVKVVTASPKKTRARGPCQPRKHGSRIEQGSALAPLQNDLGAIGAESTRRLS